MGAGSSRRKGVAVKRYRVFAALESPVAVRRDRQSERSEGVRTIAGTLVRGALAQLYLQQRGEADDVFRRLFLDEMACRFGPLDPAAHVFPQTAVACKREGSDHGIVDQLWFRIAQHWLGNGLREDVETGWRHCGRGECGVDMKPHIGFWADNNGTVQEPSHDRHSVAAHVGIDRVTVTAAESIFYTLEALDPGGDALVGWVDAEDDVPHQLQQLLDEEDHVVYIGHHRTRGYGRVRLDLDLQPATTDLSSAQVAWDGWSRELVSFLSGPPFATAGLDPDRDFFFSLSLPTGAILVDDVLRYSLDPASMVSWLAPLPSHAEGLTTTQRPAITLPTGGTLRCVAAVTKHERVRGWNAAHGLPRQDEWAVMRGSVYAYWFQGAAEPRDLLDQELSRLCEAGIGIRRNEGFGVVEVSDDFHRRFCKQEDQR
jgi:CRISPR-associated Csx10 family RAMP protein